MAGCEAQAWAPLRGRGPGGPGPAQPQDRCAQRLSSHPGPTSPPWGLSSGYGTRPSPRVRVLPWLPSHLQALSQPAPHLTGLSPSQQSRTQMTGPPGHPPRWKRPPKAFSVPFSPPPLQPQGFLFQAASIKSKREAICCPEEGYGHIVCLLKHCHLSLKQGAQIAPEDRFSAKGTEATAAKSHRKPRS